MNKIHINLYGYYNPPLQQKVLGFELIKKISIVNILFELDTNILDSFHTCLRYEIEFNEDVPEDIKYEFIAIFSKLNHNKYFPKFGLPIVFQGPPLMEEDEDDDETFGGYLQSTKEERERTAYFHFIVGKDFYPINKKTFKKALELYDTTEKNKKNILSFFNKMTKFAKEQNTVSI